MDRKDKADTETARKILAAALGLWSEKGYGQATMRELGRRIGMGVSSLYFYFRSKEEIVQYLYKTLNEEVREEFGARDDGEKDLGRNFQRFMTVKLRLLEPHRSSLGAIMREAVDPTSGLNPMSRASASVLADNVQFFRGLVARSGAARPGGEEALARLVWLGHIGVLLYWLHDRSPAFRNTATLVEKVGSATRLLPMLRALPGSGDLMHLVTDLFTTPDAAPAKVDADEPGPAREYDVVVIGAGPIGALYASFLKQQRPRTRVLVLERSPEPGHKIGESTLSGFCKAVRTVGIRNEVMQRLFYPKNGLGFLRVDRALRDLTKAPEYVLEAFDQTYQVERRVLDSLLIANAQRLGVDVVQGARVQSETLTLSARGSLLSYDVGPRTYRVRASLVVDASGPAGVLAHKLGLRTSEGLPFQTSAVWTYFAGVRPLASYQGWPRAAQFPRDQYTQHLCFPEGWLWYIPLVSWQGAPTANLSRALDRLMRAGRNLPTRDDLVEDFACPAQDVVSVGLVLRSDRDALLRDDPRGAFEHYRERYSAIGGLLEGARLLEDYYAPGQTYMSRLAFRGHSRQVAGDGWLLVGDAAFFVDPLISPGLTGGAAVAYEAVQATVRALDSGVFTAESFGSFGAFVARLHEALERDNQLVYMSFNHPEALALVQRFQEAQARRHFADTGESEYGAGDTNVWGILDDRYQELQKTAWQIVRDAEVAVGREVPVEEQSPRDYERAVGRLRSALGPFVSEARDLTPYAQLNALP
jgi:flavin-dependent dehydrogenase/AcrR family transcriptional regulator